MVRENTSINMTMKDIPEAFESSVYMSLRKRKQVASDTKKVVQKPLKKKVAHQSEVHKEVQELSSIIVSIPTMTRSEAIGKTPQNETTYVLAELVKKKKLGKISMPEVDKEEKYDDDEQPLVKRTKVVSKVSLNIFVEYIQEGSKLIASTLLNQAMDKPFIVKAGRSSS